MTNDSHPPSAEQEDIVEEGQSDDAATAGAADAEVDEQPSPAFSFALENPNQKDEFGGHQRLADALAAAIGANDPPRSIALLGPWGSGKSLAIRLVEEKLQEKAKRDTFFYTYDAWLHQSDAPRRSFIEDLVKAIAGPTGGLTKEWQDELHRLSGRLDVTDTTETPVMSAMFAWILASGFFVPIATTMLLRSDQVASILGWGNGVVVYFSLALTLAPAVLLGVEVLRRARTPLDPRDEQLPKGAGSSKYAWLAALFVNKKSDRTVKRVVKDPVPSTWEFQDLFHRIAAALKSGKSLVKQNRLNKSREALLARPKYKRLVVVIDNLDRLPDDEAKKLWSVVRSLFSHSTVTGSTNTDRALAHDVPLITTVVPLDENAVARMYGDEKDLHIQADGFLEKTFDLIVRVPRPRLEKWETYFHEKLRTALTAKVVDGELDTITYFVRTHLGESSEPVTPRRLNALINRIVSMWIQWHGKISIEHVAYYALNQRVIDADLLGFLTSRPSISRQVEGWESALCAMHFGVAEANALDVALREPLEKLLAEHPLSAEGILQFETYTKIPGFEFTLVQLVGVTKSGANTVHPGYETLLGAAYLLSKVTSERFPAKTAWREIVSSLPAATLTRSLDLSDVQSICAILSRARGGHTEIAQQFLYGISDSSDENLKSWQSIAIILRDMGPSLRNPAAASSMVTYLQIRPFAELCGSLGDVPRLRALLKPLGNADMTSFIQETVENNRDTSQALPWIVGVVGSAARIELDAVFNHAADGFRGKHGGRANSLFVMAVLAKHHHPAHRWAIQTVGEGALAATLAASERIPEFRVYVAAICLLMTIDPASWGDVKVHTIKWLNVHSTAASQVAYALDVLMPGVEASVRLVDAGAMHPWFAPLASATLVEQLSEGRVREEDLPAVLAAVDRSAGGFLLELRKNLVAACRAHPFFEKARKAVPNKDLTSGLFD